MSLRSTSPLLSNRSSPPVTRSVSRSGLRPQFQTSTPITPQGRRSLQPGMHIETVERVFESADDTDIDPNSSRFIYKEHFTVKEMTSMKKEMWYDWIEYRIRKIRRQFVPSYESLRSTLIIVVLLAMFSKYARDSYYDRGYSNSMTNGNQDSDSHFMSMAKTASEENQKLFQSVSKLVEDVQKLGDRVEKRMDSIEIKFEKYEKENEGWKNSVIEELKEINEWKSEAHQLVQSIKNDIEEEKTSRIISTEPPTAEPPAPTTTDIQVVPVRRSFTGVNVANSLIGASIDDACSSRPASAKDGIFYDVMSYFGTFKEGYVLLDREVLSPGEAWCTYDKRPTLTVKLARYVQPRSVSYQHVKWSGIVPNNAPKLYDLVACLDECCTQSEELVSNCQYMASEDSVDEQEQFCSVPSANMRSPVNHVQFRFRENHGRMAKTCAYLVRVYGEPVDPPKEYQKMPLDNETILDPKIMSSLSESQ